MKQYWEAPELWPGRAVVCIAGGSSLTAAQVAACQDREWNGHKVRVIAINDGYRIAPWADVLYFCDDKWWEWHHKKLANWGGLVVRLQGGKHDFGDARIKVLRNLDQVDGLADRRDGLHHGRNSGYQAIGLAVHLGAKRIVLLGYDMHAPLVGDRVRTHWFGDHPGGTSPAVYEIMKPAYASLPKAVAARGIEVINASPGSALRMFPCRDIGQALGEVACAPA